MWLLAVAVSLSAAGDSAAAPTIDLLEATDLPVRHPELIVQRLTGRPGPTEPAEQPSANGQARFWALDQTDNSYKLRIGELRLTSSRAAWYVEQGLAVRQEDLERSARQLDDVTYPLIARLFGSRQPRLIAPGDRITIFIGTAPGVSAYFSSWDQYPREVFPYSNEREIIVVNYGSIAPGSDGFDSTLAHELQHLVHWNANAASETWVDEGCAELAAALAVPRRVVASGAYLRNPDVQLTTWSPPSSAGPHYQAAYLFMRYFAEQYAGEAGLAELLRQPGRAPANFSTYLAWRGIQRTFEDVFTDWTIANLVNDPRPAEGRYAYRDLDVRATVTGKLGPNPATLQGAVHQFGVDYVELDSPAVGRELRFAGDLQVPLVAATPPSGKQLWWSNRADGLDSSMTRSFNLSTVPTATLRLKLWYDTERDFDYLHLLASRDGGATWTVLRGKQATEVNPSGNAIGPGYSGTSGEPGAPGQVEPVWIEEEVDLSAYAGGNMQLRFEYITDQAYNARGVLIDDVAIPEIGFMDDAERDTGWTLSGFIRSDNVIPQRWRVHLVEWLDGDEIAVQQVTVGPDGQGTAALRDARRAVLVVSGTAPRTLERGGYQVELRQR
ncbi:MAG: immune inhibitor A [Chloroflexota bacterium]